MSDFKVKMHQNPISTAALPQTLLHAGANSAPETPMDLRGLLLKGEEGWDGRGGQGRERYEWRLGKKRGREERGMLCSPKIP